MNKLNKGSIKIENNTPPNAPDTQSIIASIPFPSNNNLCPGNTLSMLASSGAPNSIDGIKLINIFIIPHDNNMIAPANGENINDNPRSIGIVLLGCRPGSKPVIIPNTVPMIKGMINSNIQCNKKNTDV